MAQRWPLIVLALLTGFVTAVRPVGVALTAAFLWHVLSFRSQSPERERRVESNPSLTLRALTRNSTDGITSSFGPRLLRAALLTPIACWGLIAFIVYQWQAFDAPFAFVQTQEHWTMAAPEDRSWEAKAVALLTLEPIRDVYDPTSRRYWENVHIPGGPPLNIMFWNPILFLLAALFLAIGAGKRWLTGSEFILGAALLAIPYVTRAYEMSMAAHGRFAAVVVVNYLVIGRLVAGAGPPLRIALSGLLALFLCLFTALYASHYLVF